jgi:ribonucleoside-diphosphate reductase alpha chain
MSDTKDPLASFLIEAGVPYTQDDKAYYFKFPMKSPEGSMHMADVSAMEQLRVWSIYQEHWCDHNPSQTIYYTDKEFLHIGAWLWDNFDTVGGLSFFPTSDHIYENTPYQEITEEEYNILYNDFPKIDWEDFTEEKDTTTGSQEYACAGGQCDL